MNYETIANILRELDVLKEQMNIPEYEISINGLINRINTLKNIKGKEIIIIDNRYEEMLHRHVLTYIGILGDEFIPLNGSIVSDACGPHIKIQFQPKTLNRFYYINRGYAISLKDVPGDIGYVYPHSEILFESDKVIERLMLEHFEPIDSTIEEFLKSLGTDEN